MRLEEVERLATRHADLTDPADPYPAELVGDLARAVLAMLGTVRAADRHRTEQSWESAHELALAVDAMRAALETP